MCRTSRKNPGVFARCDKEGLSRQCAHHRDGNYDYWYGRLALTCSVFSSNVVSAFRVEADLEEVSVCHTTVTTFAFDGAELRFSSMMLRVPRS
jgi:hypothetical protein